MPLLRMPKPLSVLACVLAAAGIVVALAGCSHVPPLGPDAAPPSLPPPRHLGAPIIVQIMRSRPATATGQCPAGTVDLSGTEPNVLRASVSSARPVPVGSGSTAAPAPAATPPVGVACYLPVGTPVTITSAAVSSVITYPRPPGGPEEPSTYGFLVAIPTAYVASVTAVIRQAYDARAAVGFTVAGKLWQAPQVLRAFVGRAVPIRLLSRNQVVQLHRLLVPSG